MAGNKIYIGELFQAMIDKLSTLLTKIDQQITELQNVKNVSASSLKSLIVKSGSTYNFNVVSTNINGVTNAIVDIGTYKSYMDGTITLNAKGTYVSSYAGVKTGNIKVSTDGGTTYADTAISIPSMQTVNFDVNIPVTITSSTVLKIRFDTPPSVTGVFSNASKFCYDIVDLVNQGGFIKTA